MGFAQLYVSGAGRLAGAEFAEVRGGCAEFAWLEWSGVQTTKLTLQIRFGRFEHGPVLGAAAVFNLRENSLKGQSKALSLAHRGGGFRRQMRLRRRVFALRFILLSFDRFALPTARHRAIRFNSRGARCRDQGRIYSRSCS